jgi:hypothetical protein
MDARLPSYVLRYAATTPTTADQLISLINTDTIGVVHIWGVNVCIGKLDAVTGVLCQFTLNRFLTTSANWTGGTDITSTIVPLDTTDTLLSTVSARGKPTYSGWTGVQALSTTIMSQNDPTVSVLDADSQAAELFPRQQIWWWRNDWPLFKPIFLRSDGTTHEGLTIDCTTGDPAGSNVEATFLFTTEGG